MSHVVIAGAGAALAQPLIDYYLECDWRITALCRRKTPARSHPSILVVNAVDFTWDEPGKNIPPLPKADLLITLMGSTGNNKIVDLQHHTWSTVLHENLTSVFKAIQLFAPTMEDANIVVVGSILGSMGGYGCANYAAAKAGLVGLVRCAANEYAAKNVRINLLELGYVLSGMGAQLPPIVRERAISTIPLKRFAEPEEVTDAIAFLGTVRYMTGDVFTLAGGLR